MDDAIDVHPVEDGLRLGRLDRVHVHLLASVGYQDRGAVAHVLLQTRPGGGVEVVQIIFSIEDNPYLAAAHSETEADTQLDTVVRSVVTVETTDL